MLSNEDFIEKLKVNNVKYKPLEKYCGNHKKIKFQCYKNPNHIFDFETCEIYDGKEHCPYCKRRKVFVGETDMWTTHPKIAKMLLNHDDGYKYFATGSQKVDWVCPNCGKVIKNKIIKNITVQGLPCPYCSDGESYSEKFISEMFRQLDVGFIHDRTTNWSRRKRYDFYIPEYSTIVETHGIQHYTRSFRCLSRKARDISEEQENDKYKKDLAIKNGIKFYIELDCKKSNLEYIKNSILNSQLSVLFDLSNIDWDKCSLITFTSKVKFITDLWNNGMKNTKDISEYTGIHICTVISSLKKAAEIGLCDYVTNYKKSSKRCKRIICVETGKIYDCINDVKKDGYNDTYVSKCCNKKCETANGFHWQFI